MDDCCSLPSSIESSKKKKWDFIFFFSVVFSFVFYSLYFFSDETLNPTLKVLSQGVYSMINEMAPGVLFGIFFTALVELIPQDMTLKLLGTGRGGVISMIRAALAGTALDLCNHGILLIAVKLYKKGATFGQTLAFLIASPWNSFSLTLILSNLIGSIWTAIFIGLSLTIAVVSGLIVEQLEKRGKLNPNPHTPVSIKTGAFNDNSNPLMSFKVQAFNFKKMMTSVQVAIKDSKTIIKWLLFGVTIAVLIRAFIPIEIYKNYLGPTLVGLAVTLVFASLLEVCSEGSVPIAGDLFNVAKAPGNSFAFLMTGVSTDYTEILVLKETTGSWRAAFILPLVTIPQIILISLIINHFVQLP